MLGADRGGVGAGLRRRVLGVGVVPDGPHQHVGERLLDLGPLDLEDRRLGAGGGPGVHGGHDPEDGVLERHQLDLDLREAFPEPWVFRERAPVAGLVPGDLADAPELGLGTGHPGDAGTLVPEEELRAGPALAFLADEVLRRHPDVLEEGVVDLLAPVHGPDRAHGDPGRAHVDEEEGDPLLPLRFPARAHQAEDPVRVLRGGRPGLLTVDDVVAAVSDRAGLEGGEVRAGPGLGVALAPPVVAREDAGEKAALLFPGPERDDDRPDHVHPERHRRRGAGRLHLFLEEVALERAPARTPVLHRPARSHPAPPVQDLLPSDLAFLVHPGAGPGALAHVFREPLAKEGAHLLLERAFLGVQGKVHEAYPG